MNDYASLINEPKPEFLNFIFLPSFFLSFTSLPLSPFLSRLQKSYSRFRHRLLPECSLPGHWQAPHRSPRLSHCLHQRGLSNLSSNCPERWQAVGKALCWSSGQTMAGIRSKFCSPGIQFAVEQTLKIKISRTQRDVLSNWCWVHRLPQSLSGDSGGWGQSRIRRWGRDFGECKKRSEHRWKTEPFPPSLLQGTF